jgi:periplasmic divalent cation tolerance protein
MCVVLSTVESREAGVGIGRNLVAEHLAACVNVLPGARSIYWWEGKVEESDEALPIIKTERARYPALARRLQELHTYTVPEVLALSVGPARRRTWPGSGRASDREEVRWRRNQERPDQRRGRSRAVQTTVGVGGGIAVRHHLPLLREGGKRQDRRVRALPDPAQGIAARALWR